MIVSPMQQQACKVVLISGIEIKVTWMISHYSYLRLIYIILAAMQGLAHHIVMIVLMFLIM